MKHVFGLLIAVAALFSAVDANAEVYFFCPEGAGEMDGSSWENAAPAEYLGETVSNAQSGDVFCLTIGNYPPDVNTGLWVLPEGITIKGGFPTTMTGTTTEITYPTEGETVFSADVDGDGTGDNGSTAFFKYEGASEDYYSDCDLITIAGVTIRDAWNQSETYKGGAMKIVNGNIELDHVKFINNKVGSLSSDGSKLNGAGGVVAAIGSRVYAHDCVWENNQSTRSGVAYLARQRGSGSGEVNATEYGITIFDRCEFTNNTVVAPTHSSANYGGTLAIADYGGTMYINNCTATGSHINLAGAFCRMGTGTSLYCTNCTFFDCTCSSSARYQGAILSCGASSTEYIANTIIVNKVDGYEGAFASVLFQNEACTFVTGGNNIWGSLNNATSTTLASSDNVDKTNTVSVVFGTNTYAANGGNGTKVIAPLETYRKTDLASLTALATEWNLPDVLDLSLDQRGMKRASTTISGAYDSNGVVTAIDDISVNSGTDALSLSSLGGYRYKINGSGFVSVYDIAGKLIKRQNAADVLDLSNCESGLYIINSDNKSVKVVK